MKDRKDIQKEVAATLGLLDELSPVLPPPGLEERVMARIAAEDGVPLRMPRRQSRLVWIAAAAAVVLAINVFTLLRWERQSNSQLGDSRTTDPIEEIRSEYSLESSLY